MSVTVERSLGKRYLKNFLPPEGVPIQFALASIGARFGAQVLDILITYGTAWALVLLFVLSDVLSFSALLAFLPLLLFFLRAPYYILSELVWNGRTLGKRITGIRVISASGDGLAPYQITARNLMKEVEIFLPVTFLFGAVEISDWTGLGLFVWAVAVLIVPFANRRRQRLGDMVAGTLVVEQPRAVLLPDLADARASTGVQMHFDMAQLSVYGRYELQALEAILRTPPTSAEGRKHVADVAQTIRQKIGYDAQVLPDGDWPFLMEFYRQQREFLEGRHLLGDSREDKHHSAPTAVS